MQYFWYRIKMTFRTPSAMFWAILFPIFLGMVFYFMFGNLDEAEQFSEVPVGVMSEEKNDMFMETLKGVKIEDLNMFDVREYDSKKEAEEALKDGTVKGLITLKGNDFELLVKKSDSYSSLIKTFLDRYRQNSVLIEDVAGEYPEQAGVLAAEISSGEGIGIREIPLKGQDKSPYTQYFYALLAMACLIVSMVGLENGMSIQADLSAVGARRNVAPEKKIKQVIIDFCASLFLYCLLMAGVLAVLVFVYRQDFGSNAGLILLATWVGSFTGLVMGYMIAVMVKGPRAKKEGLTVVVFMASSFLGGLQWGDITYIMEKYCPVINRINPATLIVNAFKSLAVFGDYRQYAVNLATLFLIGVIFLTLSIQKLRRTKYASL